MLKPRFPFKLRRSMSVNACDAGKVRHMGNVTIDIGRKSSCIVVKQDAEIVRERYVDTTADDLMEYLSDASNPLFIV